MHACNKRVYIKMLMLISVLSVQCLDTGTKVLFMVEEKNIQLFEKTISAFEKALNFYNKDYDMINFDSLLGLRVAQGCLQRILIDNAYRKLKIQDKYLANIRKMYTTAEKIIEKATPFVREDNVKMYEKFYKITGKPWGVISQFKKFNPQKIKNKKLKYVVFDGRTSDHCISTLLADSSRKRQSSCNITDHCWKFEMQKNLDGYTPPHQILYFLFGLGQGCADIFNEKFHKTATYNGLQDFFAETCSNVLQSVKKIAQNKNMLEMRKDLFMEQALVCSLTGYEDFLSEKYLEIVLSWQTDIGCFGQQV